jgi:hypothetical protein
MMDSSSKAPNYVYLSVVSEPKSYKNCIKKDMWEETGLTYWWLCPIFGHPCGRRLVVLLNVVGSVTWPREEPPMPVYTCHFLFQYDHGPTSAWILF